MGRIHPYGEPRTEDSAIGGFFLWLFLLGLALPMSYGWILVNMGWISNATLFMACSGLGVIVGLKEAIATARRNAKARKVAALQQISEVGKEGSQDRRADGYYAEEKLSVASKATLSNCEAYQKSRIDQHSSSNNALPQVHLVVDRFEGQTVISLDGYRDGDSGGGARRHRHCRPFAKRPA